MHDREAARAAIQRSMARSLAEIYPGTTWLPLERDEDVRRATAAGKVVWSFPTPEDLDPAADRSDA